MAGEEDLLHHGVTVRWCRFQFDSEWERWHVELADCDDPEAGEGDFYALVPDEIAQAHHDAMQTYSTTLEALVRLAELEEDEPARKVPCDRFEDRLTPDQLQILFGLNVAGQRRCVRCGCHHTQHPNNQEEARP